MFHNFLDEKTSCNFNKNENISHQQSAEELHKSIIENSIKEQYTPLNCYYVFLIYSVNAHGLIL